MGLIDKAKATAAGQMEQRRAGQGRSRSSAGRRPGSAARTSRGEYQVKRIGADKQRGPLGSRLMEQILNGEGVNGWELVTVNDERVTFKRRRP